MGHRHRRRPLSRDLSFGIIVWRLERSVFKALLWTAPTLMLGNPVPALYVLLNLKRIPALVRTR